MSILRVVFIAVSIFLGGTTPAPAYDVQYNEDYFYKERLNEAVEPYGYTALALPDSILMCSIVDGQATACWFMPPHSVVLVPTPESAPVDSL